MNEFSVTRSHYEWVRWHNRGVTTNQTWDRLLRAGIDGRLRSHPVSRVLMDGQWYQMGISRGDVYVFFNLYERS